MEEQAVTTEEQAVTTIETTIVETDKFSGTAKVGDEIHIYRRLADMYDKTAIAMLNASDEVVGYLNREIVEEKILSYLQQGLKYKCLITGAPGEEGDLPISISVVGLEDLPVAKPPKKKRVRKKK